MGELHLAKLFRSLSFLFSKKMRFQTFFLLVVSSFAENQKSWQCIFSCLREYIQGDIFCSLTWDPASEDYQRCLESKTQEFFQCLQVDGCTSMDECRNACVPDMLNEAWACEEAFENGEISEVEYLRCLMNASVSFWNLNFGNYLFLRFRDRNAYQNAAHFQNREFAQNNNLLQIR